MPKRSDLLVLFDRSSSDSLSSRRLLLPDLLMLLPGKATLKFGLTLLFKVAPLLFIALNHISILQWRSKR